MTLLVFDLDGVLVDTVEGHFTAWNAVARAADVEFDRDRNDALRGVSRQSAIDIVLGERRTQVDDAKRSALLELKASVYRGWVQRHSGMLVQRGTRALLDDLRKSGYTLSVASASKNAKWIIEQARLAAYFEYVSDGDDVSRTKPDPAQLNMILQRFSCPPHGAILFEDAHVGVQAGLAAGVAVVGIGTMPLSGVLRQYPKLSDVTLDDVLAIRRPPAIGRHVADVPVSQARSSPEADFVPK